MINVKIDQYSIKLEGLDWAAFSALWPLAQAEKPSDQWRVETGPCRISYAEANALAALGMTLEIKPLPGAMLTKMQDREKWEHDIRASDILDAKAVHIAIPDFGLLKITEVEVMEDCCTRELQGMLDDGWRLLAVCPPNAARRPDYILGRTKAG